MLIDLLKEIIPNANMKCCISSRPERPFDAFQGSPMLKLQDLTRNDIRAFVSSCISQHARDERLSARISDLIVLKSDGVFLWAKLVVKEEIRGLRNKDDEKTLLKRLELLPSQIEELYSDMLKRVDTVYRTEAANYIQLTRLCMTSIFDFSIQLNVFDNEMRLEEWHTDPKPIIDACAYIKERIEIVCGGFLETGDPRRYDADGDDAGEDDVLEWLSWKPMASRLLDSSLEWSHAHVGFSHRTADEFFATHEVGIEFIRANTIPRTTPIICYLAIGLARMSMCQHEQPQNYMSGMISWILPAAIETYDEHDDYQINVEALDYVNQTITNMDIEWNGARSSDFWFCRWGPDCRKKYCTRILTLTERQFVWPDDGSLPVWFPMSILGVAVLFRLHKYTSIKLQEHQHDITRKEVIQLMESLSIDIRPHFGVPFRPHSVLELILQLLKIGVQLAIHPPESLWLLFWSTLLRGKNKSAKTLDAARVEEAIGLFLESGVEPFPIIVLPIVYIRAGGSIQFLCEVDTALLPYVQDIYSDMQQRETHQYALRQPERSKTTKLQIHFKSSPDDSDIQRDYHMTDEDVQCLHRSLQAMFVAKDAAVAWAPAKRVSQTIVSIYEHITSDLQEEEKGKWPEAHSTEESNVLQRKSI